MKTVDINGCISGLRQRMCYGKARYGHSDLAEAEAERLRSLDNVPMNAYYCVFCNGHHVGRKGRHQSYINKLLTLENLLSFDFSMTAEQQRAYLESRKRPKVKSAS